MFTTIITDTRIAFRTLLKTPAFSVVTILTLAVTIGANTAIFSVVDGVLLRPLPYPEADRSVTVRAGLQPNPTGRESLRFSDRASWHFVNNNRSFDIFAGYSDQPTQVALTGDGDPLQVNVAQLTASAFDLLGVLPQRGRFPTVEEDVRGATLVTLLSDGLWRGRYGSDPGVIGMTVTMNGLPFEVTGIMPAGYDFPTPETDT